MASPRARLSVDKITAAALQIVDVGGVEALTMRRLGESLGVEAMSIYKHLPDKGAVLDAMIATAIGEMRLDQLPARWDDRIRLLGAELRRVALAHPHLFARMATRIPAGIDSTRHVEVLLGALHDADLTPDRVTRHFWTCVAYTMGALLAETAALTGVGDPAIAAPTGEVAAGPMLVRYGPRLAACEFQREYRRGLEVQIDAIRAAAR